MNCKMICGLTIIVMTLFLSCTNSERDFIAIPIDGGKEVAIIDYIGSKWKVRIPSRIQNLRVTHIEENAFFAKNLTNVIIPNHVTYIGNAAFADNQLTNVIIPNRVIHIGNAVFSGNQLTSVKIGKNVTHIGDRAFTENQLTSVTIPNRVTYIGDEGFARNQLTSVTIGKNVTDIGRSAFTGNQLTNVTIPNSILTLGHNAFSDNKITSIIIPNNEIEIWWNVFNGNELNSITFQNGKKLIKYTYSNEMWIENGFGDSLFIQIGLDRANGTIFDPDFLYRIHEYSNIIQNIPIVKNVTSIVNADYITGTDDSIIVTNLFEGFSSKPEDIDKIKRRFLSWRMYENILFSDDFTATNILVSISLRSRKSISLEDVRYFKQISDIAQNIFSDYSTVYITGIPIISKNFINVVNDPNSFFYNKFGNSKIVSIVLEGNSSNVLLRPDTLAAMDGLSHYLENNLPNIIKVMGFTDLVKRINQVFNVDQPPEGISPPQTVNYEDFGFGFADFGFNDYSIVDVDEPSEAKIEKLYNFSDTGIIPGISYYEIPVDPKRYGKVTSEDLRRLIANYLVLLAGGPTSIYANDPLEPTAIKSMVLLHNVNIKDIQLIFTEIQQYIDKNFPSDVNISIFDNTPWEIY